MRLPCRLACNKRMRFPIPKTGLTFLLILLVGLLRKVLPMLLTFVLVLLSPVVVYNLVPSLVPTVVLPLPPCLPALVFYLMLSALILLSLLSPLHLS